MFDQNINAYYPCGTCCLYFARIYRGRGVFRAPKRGPRAARVRDVACGGAWRRADGSVAGPASWGSRGDAGVSHGRQCVTADALPQRAHQRVASRRSERRARAAWSKKHPTRADGFPGGGSAGGLHRGRHPFGGAKQAG